MKKRINPRQVLCFGKTFPEMGDEVIYVSYLETTRREKVMGGRGRDSGITVNQLTITEYEKRMAIKEAIQASTMQESMNVKDGSGGLSSPILYKNVLVVESIPSWRIQNMKLARYADG